MWTTPRADGFVAAEWRVAQAFDLAGITNTMGCPVLRAFCEGREPRTIAAVQPMLSRAQLGLVARKVGQTRNSGTDGTFVQKNESPESHSGPSRY
jgi:hypothetical protein